ncbi:MAG: hypothetical protein LUH19_05995, partial [Lachnospiraceae bacterium]|nr:hypothetical protein [Lachnospiraceae bacterium]
QVKRTKNAKDKTVVKKANKLRKQMEQSKKLEEQIEAGKISVLDIFPLAGYRLLGILKWDSKQDIYVKLYHKCMQFKEEKEAKHYTEYLLASLAGCLLLAAFSLFAGCAIGLAAGMGTRSIVLGVVVMAIFVLVGYVPYDNVSVMINKRAEEIEWQFPQVMSQMTLLVVAGMEVRQAWELSAKSGSGTLYEEMRRVLVGLENNEMPVDVYGRFI